MAIDDHRQRLNHLLTTQGEQLYATLARLTLRGDAASDLLQELFARLAASAGFKTVRDPEAYAFRTAINLAMEWRRRQRSTPLKGEPLIETASIEPSALTQMIRAEDMHRVLEGLTVLSELTREAFVLRMIERLSYETIAQRMDKTPHQVRGLCYAALQQLRAILAEESRPAGRPDLGDANA